MMYTVLYETIILIMDIGQKRWGKKQKQTTKQSKNKQTQNTGKEMGHFFLFEEIKINSRSITSLMPITWSRILRNLIKSSTIIVLVIRKYLILVSVLLSPNRINILSNVSFLTRFLMCVYFCENLIA